MKQQRRFVLPVELFAAGGAIGAAAMITPFHKQFVYGLTDAALLTAIQSQMNRGLEIGAQLRALGISFAQTPIVVIAGLCALVRKRNLPLLAGFLVALLFAFSTNLYRLRVLYLLPYLYVRLMLFAGAGFIVARHHIVGTFQPIRQGSAGFDRTSARSDRWRPGARFHGGTRSVLRRKDRESPSHCFSSCSQTVTLPSSREEPDALTQGILEKLGYRFETVIFPDGGHQSSLFGWNYAPGPMDRITSVITFSVRFSWRGTLSASTLQTCRGLPWSIDDPAGPEPNR